MTQKCVLHQSSRQIPIRLILPADQLTITVTEAGLELEILGP